MHICWGPYLIDVIFRVGSAHSNHGTDYIDSITDIVNLIRRGTPVRFRLCCAPTVVLPTRKRLNISKTSWVFITWLPTNFIKTSKNTFWNCQLKDTVNSARIKRYGSSSSLATNSNRGNASVGVFLPNSPWIRVASISWIYPGQIQLFQPILACVKKLTTNYWPPAKKYFEAETIISLTHERGADELIHRSVKELATKEQLPFQSFGMNRAYYYLLVIVHFMFECYKRDITPDVIPVTAYPNTFRRKLIDFAVKITSRSRYIIMNVTRTIFETIQIDVLWKRCQSPPIIQFA